MIEVKDSAMKKHPSTNRAVDNLREKLTVQLIVKHRPNRKGSKDTKMKPPVGIIRKPELRFVTVSPGVLPVSELINVVMRTYFVVLWLFE